MIYLGCAGLRAICSDTRQNIRELEAVQRFQSDVDEYERAGALLIRFSPQAKEWNQARDALFMREMVDSLPPDAARCIRPYLTRTEGAWCGAFVYLVLQGFRPLPRGRKIVSSQAYRTCLSACEDPVFGAVAVLGRGGVRHVGFVVGESADFVYLLGGNQQNMVCVAPFRKSAVAVYRYPAQKKAWAPIQVHECTPVIEISTR